MKSAGYQHRADNEFILGVDDEQEIYNHLFDIFSELPEFANRSGEPRGKVATIRRILEERMGRPIADTDKDFSGRLPYWVDKYLNGKMSKQIVVQQITPEIARQSSLIHVPKGMTVKHIPVLIPEGDEVDSYRITFKKRRS